MSAHRRRRNDHRPPAPQILAPTPALAGPADPPAVLRSIADALVAARRTRRPVTLVVLEMGPDGDADAGAARVMAEVRRLVRRTDGVWRFGDRALAILLLDADGPEAEPALARMRLRLRDERALHLSMGRAAAAPGIDAISLMELARSDMRSLIHA